jgi:hypothetical protein
MILLIWSVQIRSFGQHVPSMPSFLSKELGELFVRVLVGRTLLMLERYAHIGNAPFCLYTDAFRTDSVIVVVFHRELTTIRTIQVLLIVATPPRPHIA